MNSDAQNATTRLLQRAALFRGLYSRVAKQLGVDPSYVSRVARGQRRNDDIENALIREVRRLDGISESGEIS